MDNLSVKSCEILERQPLLGRAKKDGHERSGEHEKCVQPKRWIIVEPFLVLYSLAGMPLGSLKSQYMYQRIASDMGINLKNLSSDGTSECGTNASDPGFIARESVQAANTEWNMYISLVNYVPAVVMLLVYGSFSDRFGRRLTLIAPVIGGLMTIILQSAIVFFELPVWCFLFGAVEYLFGGFYVIITGVFAYIADTVPVERRAVRMAVLNAIILANAGIGNVIMGHLIDTFGYFYPYLFCFSGKLLCLIYAVFCVPETVREASQISSSDVDILDNLKRGIKLYLIDNGAGRRHQLNLLLISYLIAELISTNTILTLYEMNAPLCWDSVLIGYFGALSDLIKCAGMIVAAFILKRWLPEQWLAALGIFSNVCYYLYLAFVYSTAMMFLSPAFGSLTFLYIPMIRALMSKLVNLNEQGSLFAVLMVVITTASLFSTLTSNKIYSATLFLMEGFIFLVGAGLQVISLLVLLIFICISRTAAKQSLEKSDSKVKA